MTSENANAYPLDLETINRAENGRYSFTGLTKLEYFAGLAMQGLLANDQLSNAERFNSEVNGFARHCIAAASVIMAKSLIEQLNKEDK